MGSVIARYNFSKKHLLYFGIFLAYFIGAILFVYFGLQPATSATEVYAKEESVATSTLEIPSINLVTPVMQVSLNDNNLEVPEQIAGFYSAHKHKTLLIGHSTTVFSDLKELKLDQKIIYNQAEYIISEITTKEKSEISMKDILKEETGNTLVLMTCTGEKITDTDFSHRLIITAKQI